MVGAAGAHAALAPVAFRTTAADSDVAGARDADDSCILRDLVAEQAIAGAVGQGHFAVVDDVALLVTPFGHFLVLALVNLRVEEQTVERAFDLGFDDLDQRTARGGFLDDVAHGQMRSRRRRDDRRDEHGLGFVLRAGAVRSIDASAAVAGTVVAGLVRVARAVAVVAGRGRVGVVALAALHVVLVGRALALPLALTLSLGCIAALAAFTTGSIATSTARATLATSTAIGRGRVVRTVAVAVVTVAIADVADARVAAAVAQDVAARIRPVAHVVAAGVRRGVADRGTVVVVGQVARSVAAGAAVCVGVVAGLDGIAVAALLQVVGTVVHRVARLVRAGRVADLRRVRIVVVRVGLRITHALIRAIERTRRAHGGRLGVRAAESSGQGQDHQGLLHVVRSSFVSLCEKLNGYDYRCVIIGLYPGPTLQRIVKSNKIKAL